MTAPVPPTPSSKNSALGLDIWKEGLIRLGVSPAVSQPWSTAPVSPSGPAMNPPREVESAVPIMLIRSLVSLCAPSGWSTAVLGPSCAAKLIAGGGASDGGGVGILPGWMGATNQHHTPYWGSWNVPVWLTLDVIGSRSVPGFRRRSEERRVGKECRSRW